MCIEEHWNCAPTVADGHFYELVLFEAGHRAFGAAQAAAFASSSKPVTDTIPGKIRCLGQL